jgi:predicted transcriptional regulator
MTSRNSSAGALTGLQKAILNFVETNGAVTADQVREGLKRDHPLKDSSVRTLLRRLEARGLVSHVDQRGRRGGTPVDRWVLEGIGRAVPDRAGR